MAIDRAEIAQAHFLENQAAAVTAAAIRSTAARAGLQRHFGQRAFEAFFGFMRQLEGEFAFGQTPHKSLEILRQLVVDGCVISLLR